MTARARFDFTGTRALVTGATSGIGHAVATIFRDGGADVIATGTKPDATGYDADLSGMTYRQLVLTDPESIAGLAAGFTSPDTALDVLVNNAGANFPGGLDESHPDGFDASVELNLFGPYRLTVALHHALKASTAPGGAAVVNLASMSALRAGWRGTRIRQRRSASLSRARTMAISSPSWVLAATTTGRSPMAALRRVKAAASCGGASPESLRFT
jgi:NAD(P)-dependent dehydrogenase (short-subunit alcohol dehydrogenase family)